MKSIKVEYDEDEGTYHVVLVYANGDELTAGRWCDEDEANQSADDINRWAQE